MNVLLTIFALGILYIILIRVIPKIIESEPARPEDIPKTFQTQRDRPIKPVPFSHIKAQIRSLQPAEIIVKNAAPPLPAGLPRTWQVSKSRPIPPVLRLPDAGESAMTAPVTQVSTTETPKPPETKGKPAAKEPAAAKKPATGKKAGTARATGKKAADKTDNLKLIRGIGPKNEGKLHAIGITSFRQIAEWSDKDQAEFGERLSFPGRIEREEWVRQAKLLADGQTTEFSERVKHGDVATSL